jgi:hypothetical protein
MKHLLLGAAALLMCSGCLSAYSDGPEYASASPPSGFAVVHIYRPHKSFGALQMIEASQPGRVVILPSGGFATLNLKGGTIDVGSVNEAPLGVGFELDVSGFTPLSDWKFAG